MKLPEPPPDWSAFIQKPPPGFWQALNRADFQETVRRACGERYPYWDKLKYWPAPPGIEPSWVWVYREMLSHSTRVSIPLRSKTGENFSFWLPDRAQELLHLVDKRTAGPILSDHEPFHSPERYIAHSLAEEAIASSQIEGAATTRDAAREMLTYGRRPVDKSERMILNNYRAIQHIRECKGEPISLERILELQTILTEDTLDDATAAGRLRTANDDIVVKDSDSAQTVLHRPPPSIELPERLARLIDFANNATPGVFIHPVAKAIALHFWIGYDHPFVDGNGRTARALFYWYLLKEGYHLVEFISLSRIVHRSYRLYKLAYLYSEAPGQDLTYFMMYNLRAVDAAIRELLLFIDKKKQELSRAHALIRRLPDLNHRQRELVVDALKNPGRNYTVRSHKAAHLVTLQTARTDLTDLVSRGYLRQHKSGKSFFYIPIDDLAERLKMDPL